MNRKKLSIIVGLILFLSFLNENCYNRNVSFNEENSKIKQSDLLEISPLIIDDSGGGDYTWAEAVLQPWCTGAGIWSDPYVIENITINGASSGSCIEIRSSAAYFLIRNCIFYGAGLAVEECAGIKLVNTDNGKIINNDCSNNNRHGIYLHNSDNNTVMNNLANNNYWNGINLKISSNNTISGNLAQGNDYGIKLYDDCYYNQIIQNEFNNNDQYGIHLEYNCDFNIIQGNQVTGNGCGIKIRYYSNSNEISDNNIKYNIGPGVFLDYHCNYHNIINNTINQNNGHGIYLLGGCQHNLIKENTVVDNSYGVYLNKEIDHYSNYNKIIKNNINLNSYGIQLYWADNNIISGNNITYNSDYGIYLTAWSYDNNITENYFIDNGINGLDNGINSLWNKSLRGNYWSDYPFRDLDEDGIGDLPYNIPGSANSMDYLPIWDDGIESGPYFVNEQEDFIMTECDRSKNITWTPVDINKNYDSYKIVKDGIVISNGTWNGSQFFYLNLFELLPGIYNFTCKVNDTDGYKNASTVIVTILKDTFNPQIFIIDPKPYNIYGNKSIDFEILIDEPNLNTTWYSLNNGLNYTFTDFFGKIDDEAWKACGNGTVVIKFYANDSFGNFGSEEITIRKYTYFPQIIIVSPKQNQIFGTNSPSFELQIDEPKLDSIWYNLNSGLNYSSTGSIDKINQDAWDSCANGTVTIRFYANNSGGNIAFLTIKILKDIINPIIIINSPFQNQLFGNITIDYNISIIEPNLNSTWYTLNNGLNYTFTDLSGKINQSAWNTCDNGTVSIRFYANDTGGNIGSKEVIVRKDNINPNITIITPSKYQVFEEEVVNFDLVITEPNLNSTWYTLNNGLKHMFTGFNGSIKQSAWSACENGTVSIRFYANDTLGNIGFAEVKVYKDIYIPQIIINSPTPNQVFGHTSPFFNVSIIGDDIHTRWYLMNDTFPHEFTGTSGWINQETWDLIGSGEINIKFYANNSAGRFRVEEVSVLKYIDLTEKTAYALIIGISDYPESSNDLSYCDDDAYDIYNLLVDDFNFKPENIILLQNTSANKNNISNAFDQISSIISSDDIFFFYYSGHGGANTYNGGQFSHSISSPHPYPNDYDNTWSIYHPDAAFMRVHFTNIYLEDGYDIVYLGDTSLNDGYYYDYFTGYWSDVWSYWIPLAGDNQGYIRLISDYSITDWGFYIDKYEVELYDGTQYLCSYDSIPSTPSNYYLDTLLDSKLDSIKCSEKYVVMDSCHSGGMIDEVQEIGRYIMSACEYDESSLEDLSRQNGCFTYNFLNAFSYATDTNGDGVRSLEECYSYTYSNTVSRSSSLGYTHHPQQYDGIIDEAVLYATFGSVSLNPSGNTLSYSFDLYGTGLIEELYVLVCNASHGSYYRIEDLTLNPSSITGFGSYSGVIQLDGVSGFTGYGIYAKIQGNRVITINNSISNDSDNDLLDDIFEVFIGLDPSEHDTDFDGLSDYFEYYGITDPLLNDTEGDGLLDGEEVLIYGTDPLNSDTDFDTMPDKWEIDNLLNPLINDSDNDPDNDLLTNSLEYQYNTDPQNPDTDSDGLLDGEEVNTHNTDPLDEDTDSDTIPDGWEVINSLDPLTNDAALDPDNDILTNSGEYQNNTDPQNPDTDSDGLLDGEEVNLYGTDPLLEDTDSDGLLDGEEVNLYGTDPLLEDTDSDGLLDGEEVNTHNTDPLDEDTDSDTMPDGWEVTNSLDPLTNDAALDPDNDSLTNLGEYQNNTDPQNPDTDGDEWTDGDEVLVYDTDPLDPDDHPNPRTPPAIPGYTLGLILLNMIGVSIFWIMKTKKRYFKN